jgi:hypothetical protein
MMKYGYIEGYSAQQLGLEKMHRHDLGAVEFNLGWDAGALEQRVDNERMEHNQIYEEREIVKARICDQDGELDVEALADVLHELGIRGW